MSNFIYPFLFKRLNLPKIVNVFTVHCFECFIFNGVQELLQYIKCLECYVIKNVLYIVKTGDTVTHSSNILKDLYLKSLSSAVSFRMS